MKQLLHTITACALSVMTLQAQEEYTYKVDLNKVVNDQLSVELEVPALKKKKVTFQMPKIVPGTYSIYDFGRFVSAFKALDKEGKELSVEHPDENTWVINDAKELTRISYNVEDTWDTDKGNVIFEPAGTNIDKEVFVFNNHGIFGYLKGYERLGFKIEVDRPENLFGGTSMERIGGDKDTDIFKASSYNFLVDNPIMFAKADTVNFKVGNADVLIHTYSPTGRVKSSALVGDIKPILEAQRAYLGGTLPVDRYAFLIFLNAEGDMYLSQAAGALEHSYSSFYCLFEGEPEGIAQTVRDVAAHEFFHIVTPLSIHSKEIHYFDFIEPEMSKHLWLYEGGTEYAAQHVQVKEGLMPMDQFLSVMGSKMTNAARFDATIPFTVMSEECLDKHKDQYGNVYQQGALINMCLDLQLLELSEGKYGIQRLMQDLSTKYGIEKPFKDKRLFKDIGKLSGHKKEMKNFFKRYVEGAEKLPIERLVKTAGITYKESGIVKELSPFGFNPNKEGGISFDFTEKKLVLLEPGIDAFGKSIGFEAGDMLLMWNGEKLTMENIQGVLTKHAMAAKSEGYKFTVSVLRKDENGALKPKRFETVLKKVEVEVSNAFIVDENPTATQLTIRKAWLGTEK